MGCWALGITLTSAVQRDFILFFVALKAAGHAYKFQQLPAKAKQDPTIKVQGSAFLPYYFPEQTLTLTGLNGAFIQLS